MLKHVTSVQFMWVSYDKDGKVFRAARSGYSRNENTYEETPRQQANNSRTTFPCASVKR